MLKIENNYQSIVLCILDGFGISQEQDQSSNAIKLANTPCLDYLFSKFPHTKLFTSGEIVGLPEGQMGNSEVGHMTIGSGRIIEQDLLRINNAISNGVVVDNSIIKKLVEDHANFSNTIHLIGLCSDGGVHSHINHLIFIAELLAKSDVNIRLHLFLDGRDVGVSTAVNFLERIDQLVEKFPNIKIATIAGRFYAMDRDNRWDRTEKSYRAIVEANANKISGWKDYLKQQYQDNIYDEFIIPAVIDDYNGINDNDSIFFINFRSDRVRQLADSMVMPEFSNFKTKKLFLKNKIGMTNYSSNLNTELSVLFPDQIIKNNLSEVLSENCKTQLRIAETEKYAHVTFFFNCGIEKEYLGEERILIPSPNVRTYDLQPEMSAYAVTDKLVEAIESKKYNLIIVNYANCDMVGHSGNLKAAIKSVEVIDSCLERVTQAIRKVDAIMMITADHGNVESMEDDNKNPHTSHTTNPVPLLFVANDLFENNFDLENGNLSDIAPTILKIMNIAKPNEMTGKSILF